ncbi:MAG: hypothetical protein O2794_02185 [bacterium]|nr:hypothetical protein [bacterium]
MTIAERITGLITSSGAGTLVSTLLPRRGLLTPAEIKEFETIFRFPITDANQDTVRRRLGVLRNFRDRLGSTKDLRRRFTSKLARAQFLAIKLGYSDSIPPRQYKRVR